MTELIALGYITNVKPLEKEFGKLKTNEIIITNERIEHIKTRHPEDYELFMEYSLDVISDPDIIIKDMDHQNSVFMIKRLTETNVNVIVKLITDTDDSEHKNSVMTFYRIRDKNLKKLEDKNKILYKKEYM
jgi:hypothetical protein